MNQSATSDVVEKMRVFRKKQITHSILKDSFDRLLWVVRQEPEDVEEVYLLVGPSGCGKSTLLKRLEADILVLYSKEMETDPGMVPVIFARLTAPQDGNFNWKDFFSRLLEKFNDVLIRRKVILRSEAILDGETITTIRTLVREELRRAVRNAFTLRKTKFLLLDESGHLLITKSTIPARVQFEIVKSIAQELHVPIIMAGDYSLLGIVEFNGQLTRRTEIIHFPRYQVVEMTDLMNTNGMSFRNVVFTLLEAMPVAKEEGLIEHIDYFFQNSIGIVGLLKRWLERALWKTLMSEERVLTKAILQSARWSNKHLKLILAEAKRGEALLEDIEDLEIAKELGLTVVASINAVTNNFPSLQTECEREVHKKRRGTKRPGTRSPSRDQVGGIKYAT